MIVSYAFWQRHFGGDESVLGRTLALDGRSYEIVGIMPPGFKFLDLKPQPEVIDAIRIDAAKIGDARRVRPVTTRVGLLELHRRGTAQGRCDAAPRQPPTSRACCRSGSTRGRHAPVSAKPSAIGGSRPW